MEKKKKQKHKTESKSTAKESVWNVPRRLSLQRFSLTPATQSIYGGLESRSGTDHIWIQRKPAVALFDVYVWVGEQLNKPYLLILCWCTDVPYGRNSCQALIYVLGQGVRWREERIVGQVIYTYKVLEKGGQETKIEGERGKESEWWEINTYQDQDFRMPRISFPHCGLKIFFFSHPGQTYTSSHSSRQHIVYHLKHCLCGVSVDHFHRVHIVGFTWIRLKTCNQHGSTPLNCPLVWINEQICTYTVPFIPL